MSTASDLALLQFEFAWDVQVGSLESVDISRLICDFVGWNLRSITQNTRLWN